MEFVKFNAEKHLDAYGHIISDLCILIINDNGSIERETIGTANQLGGVCDCCHGVDFSKVIEICEVDLSLADDRVDKIADDLYSDED